MLFLTILLVLIIEGVLSIAYLGVVVIYYLLYAFGAYKLFSKTNRPGWWAFVPIFNEYQIYKLAWDPTYFWVYFGSEIVLKLFYKEDSFSIIKLSLSLLTLIVQFVVANKLAKAFNRSTAFGLGLFFFPAIFTIILGLSDSRYIGRQY